MEIFYHFIHQAEPRKIGGSRGRFKRGEATKKFWVKHRENFSNKEHYLNYPSRITGNQKKGLRKWTRVLNKLKTTDEVVNSKPYVMPTYKYGFIKYESFTPRYSNRLKYRMLIPREVYIRWTRDRRQEEKNKMFDTKAQVVYTIDKLEKEHMEYVKSKYDKYFETRNY